MKKIPTLLFALAAAGTAACSSEPTSPGLASDGAVSLSSSASSGTVVVTETDITRQAENTPPTDNWVLYKRNAGAGAFRTGPGTAPLGIGSFEFVTPTGADKATLFNFDHAGTSLSAVDGIAYSTYRTAGSAQQVAALNVQVDVNGSAPGGFTTLVFEPVYNISQGAVVNGGWQSWNAYSGGQAIWWSSNAIPGAPNRDTFVSWQTITSLNPDAVIIAFGVNQGSGNPALTTAVDGLTLSYGQTSTTYDFEPYRVAADAGACRNGGWESVKRADGSGFKNQGDCVSYANNGK